MGKGIRLIHTHRSDHRLGSTAPLLTDPGSKTNDPVYSVAKSFVSTTASLAFAKGLIRSVDDPAAAYIHDGGYDSPHNAKISWKNHLQQESEWEGELWGKNANFLGVEEFAPLLDSTSCVHLFVNHTW